jgi:hypothetical protein
MQVLIPFYYPLFKLVSQKEHKFGKSTTLAEINGALA